MWQGAVDRRAFVFSRWR